VSLYCFRLRFACSTATCLAEPKNRRPFTNLIEDFFRDNWIGFCRLIGRAAADDPEYIVRLVTQVVRASIETVKIVKALPMIE